MNAPLEGPPRLTLFGSPASVRDSNGPTESGDPA